MLDVEQVTGALVLALVLVLGHAIFASCAWVMCHVVYHFHREKCVPEVVQVVAFLLSNVLLEVATKELP